MESQRRYHRSECLEVYKSCCDCELVEVVGRIWVFEKLKEGAGGYDYDNECGGYPKGSIEIRFIIEDLAESGFE